MAIGKRIREARLKKSLTQEELAKIVGVTKGAIANYENNTSHPKEPVMYSLIDALDVDANFLFQDFVKTPNTPTVLSDGAQKLAMDYDSLDAHGQRMVRVVADEELRRMEAEAAARKEREAMEAGAIAEKGSDNVMPFRKSIQSCSAGTGVYLGPEEFEIIYVAENELTLRGDFAVPVSGNSMEPNYHDSDILIIEATEDIPVGKIGLFTMDGEGYVKERGENTLLSLNPQYDPIPMREGIRCNGLVIGILDPQWIK